MPTRESRDYARHHFAAKPEADRRGFWVSKEMGRKLRGGKLPHRQNDEGDLIPQSAQAICPHRAYRGPWDTASVLETAPGQQSIRIVYRTRLAANPLLLFLRAFALIASSRNMSAAVAANSQTTHLPTSSSSKRSPMDSKPASIKSEGTFHLSRCHTPAPEIATYDQFAIVAQCLECFLPSTNFTTPVS